MAPPCSTALPGSIDPRLTCNARSGRHDDLVLALAIAVWLAAGGGSPANGFFEATRRRVGSGVARTAVAGTKLPSFGDTPLTLCAESALAS